VASTSGSKRKGRYFSRISGSSSAAEMASSGTCARVLSVRGEVMDPILWIVLKRIGRVRFRGEVMKDLMGGDDQKRRRIERKRKPL